MLYPFSQSRSSNMISRLTVPLALLNPFPPEYPEGASQGRSRSLPPTPRPGAQDRGGPTGTLYAGLHALYASLSAASPAPQD